MTETKALAPMLIAPQTFDEWMRLAETLAKSQLVPKDFQGKPSDVLVAMQMGVSVGLNPFQAVQSIAVINGRPCMWGDAVLGIVMQSAAYEDVEEAFDEATMVATCTAKRKGKKAPTVRTFSLADAKAAKVYAKDNQGNFKLIALADKPGPWQGYPKRMLQMRARAWALRDAFPDVLKGLAVREEVADYDDEPKEPRLIGGQTIEDRLADMMPKEKPAPADVDVEAPEFAEPPGAVVVADSAVQDFPLPTPVAEPLPQHGENDTYQPMTDAEVKAEAPVRKSGLEPGGSCRAYTTRFMIGKQAFETAGITRAQMLELFKICPAVGKKLAAPDAPAKMLRSEFKKEHRADLTAEEAERYTVRLREILDA